MKPPKPETRTALLANPALTQNRVTLHRFLETRECVLEGADGGPAWEFIFQCTVTGFERRWGTCRREDDIQAVIEEEGN